MNANSFDAHSRLTAGDATYDVFRLDRVAGAGRLPYSLKVLLENLLRNEDGNWFPPSRSGRSAPGIRRRRAALRSSSPRPVC
jgi:aconitase A